MKRILILSANPKDTIRLRVDEEMREIKEGLRRSRLREQFVIETSHAVRYRDIRRAILDFEPNIVHFSGHGEGEEGLVFEDETGQAKLVEAEALARLFELFADRIECVVLNACYSEVQARAIARHIPYVVGMNKAIGDRAAIEFAVGFYDGLGAGRSVEFAYKLGRNSINLAGIPEHLTSQLLSKINELNLSGSSPARVDRETEQPMEHNLDSPTGKKSQIQIFIAHANEDKPQVRELYTKLKQAGYKPWLDEEDLIPGLNWREEIPKALKSSDLFLACLSSTSIRKRGYIQREFKMAMEMLAEMPSGTIYLIPLKLDDCEIPELRQSEYGLNLRDLQWLDYWKPNGFEKLIKAIEYQFGSNSAQNPESPLPSTASNDELINNSNNPRLQSLQKEKKELEEQISHLESMRTRCSKQIKGEGDWDKREQLKIKRQNYSDEIDELLKNLKNIEDKIIAILKS